MIEFKGNGSLCAGYLAAPDAKGPGVIVIQEWWGLVDHIKAVCDRLADEGFTALAPDLYNGVQTKEPDEAAKLMMALKIKEAAAKMSGAVDYLSDDPMVEPKRFGSIGFCMGGALSIVLATTSRIDAAVSYYGLPTPEMPVDYSNINGAVMVHVAAHDDWVTEQNTSAFVQQLKSLGKDAEMFVYPGTDHAFFNDSRPEVFDDAAAKQSWERTIDFLKKRLSG